MTVQGLIARLKKCDPNKEVFVSFYDETLNINVIVEEIDNVKIS